MEPVQDAGCASTGYRVAKYILFCIVVLVFVYLWVCAPFLSVGCAVLGDVVRGVPVSFVPRSQRPGEIGGCWIVVVGGWACRGIANGDSKTRTPGVRAHWAGGDCECCRAATPR
jgi:hypothetical protein